MTDVDAESWVLTTEPGRALLARVEGTDRPGPRELARWRKDADGAQVAAALRLAVGRVKGTRKFERADRMWLDPVGLEQATSEPVARHKARRFGGECGGGTVVDLCAGVGGDSLALAARGANVLAVDSDRGMCRRLIWNAGAYDVSGRVLAIQARAERFPIPAGARVHVDPDRRAGRDRRARGIGDYSPGLEVLRSIVATAPGGAIKLGPASDFEAWFGGPEFEVELTSLAGECKEATVWFGGLRTARRRATRLPENVSWTERDGKAGADAPLTPLSSWIFDPDPALIRAGLLGSFADAHGLGRCAAGVDYLTGDRFLATPFLAAFEVIKALAVDLKGLRRLVAERGLGPLEIKTRGLDLTPEALRKHLRPLGTDNPATLLLMGGKGPARAVLARRASGGSVPRE